MLIAIYNSLITPHVNYGLLLWGTKPKEIFELQKKPPENYLLVITAHTEPLFKDFNIKKISDIYSQKIMKFVFNYCINNLPSYFYAIPDYLPSQHSTQFTDQ